MKTAKNGTLTKLRAFSRVNSVRTNRKKMAKHQMKFVLLPHRRDGLAVPRNWHNLWKVQNITTFFAKTAFSN